MKIVLGYNIQYYTTKSLLACLALSVVTTDALKLRDEVRYIVI